MVVGIILGALALVGLLVSTSATVAVVILGGMVTTQLQAENRAILSSAAHQLAAEATNIDGDSVPEITALRPPAPGEPGLPAGAWYIAASSAAAKVDVWGALLVVCAVDNGIRSALPELAGLIPGTSVSTAINAAPLFAIIMAGENGQLETDCTTALAGNATGDDLVRRVSVADGMALAGPLVATAPTTVEYGTDGVGSLFKVNGSIASQTLSVSGAAAAGRLTLGTPLAIGDGGTSASTAAGAWLAILNGAPATSLAWQVAGAVQVSGGTINGTSIGSTTPAAGTFTTLTSGSAQLSGGTINGTSIGSTTPATGTFTTLTSGSAQLSGGTINGTSIGSTTPAVGNFTTLTVSGSPVWTAANDGAGSGLDADRIDGVAVQATGASNGNVLQYNGTGWVPGTLQAGGGGTVGLVEADTWQTVTARGATTTQVVTAAGYQYSSDPRLKVDMRPIGGAEALDMVMRLEGLRYTRLATAEAEIGFNAEAVEAVAPELVRVGPDGYRSLAYGNVSAVLVQALHEMGARQRVVEAGTYILGGLVGLVLLLTAAAWWWRRGRGAARALVILVAVAPVCALLIGSPSPAHAQSCPGGVPGTVRCVAAGGTTDIDAYGVCRRVTNNRALAVMIPIGSAADWSSARTGAGAVVTMSGCYSYAWTGWSGWSGCSASCGGGSQSQSRSCQQTETGVGGSTTVDPSLCGGGSTSQSQSCNTQSCCTPSAHVDGYGGCSASCGGGSQTVFWSDGCGSSWTSSQSCNTGSCCAGNQGQQCNRSWCQGTEGASCSLWAATPTTCDAPTGGFITSCSDGGNICCSKPDGHVQCDGSCQ